MIWPHVISMVFLQYLNAAILWIGGSALQSCTPQVGWAGGRKQKQENAGGPGGGRGGWGGAGPWAWLRALSSPLDKIATGGRGEQLAASAGAERVRLGVRCTYLVGVGAGLRGPYICELSVARSLRTSGSARSSSARWAVVAARRNCHRWAGRAIGGKRGRREGATRCAVHICSRCGCGGHRYVCVLFSVGGARPS